MPHQLVGLLARDKKAAAAWERLSYTNKKEIARGLEEAKQPETRERRLRAAIAKLRAPRHRLLEDDSLPPFRNGPSRLS
jgi:uncharacterized protein YdeI (YjbR/CyaY-like superfamily)